MDSLILSTPLTITSPSLPAVSHSFTLHNSLPCSLTQPNFLTPPRLSNAPSLPSRLNRKPTPTPAPSTESLLLHLSSSSPQTPSTAMRGAEADAVGLLLKEQIFFLGSSIDDLLADAIISQLLLLDAQEPTKDIRLFINSAGASLSATMAIFDVVRLVRADVSTVALGISASTSSFILAGGTKGKRFAKYTNHDTPTDCEC